MKYTNTLYLLFIAALLLLSCKKSNDGDKWAEELKDSVWAGEFRYTTGTYTDPQPFSAILKDDGTLTWYQTTVSVKAKWKAENNKITISFSDGRTLTADLATESWSNFVTSAGSAYRIENVYRSSIPKPELLENTTWTGSALSRALIIKFSFPQKTDITFSLHYVQDYIVFGAGILTTGLPYPQSNSYMLFPEKGTIKGYSIQNISSQTYDQFGWVIKKQ